MPKELSLVDPKEPLYIEENPPSSTGNLSVSLILPVRFVGLIELALGTGDVGSLLSVPNTAGSISREVEGIDRDVDGAAPYPECSGSMLLLRESTLSLVALSLSARSTFDGGEFWRKSGGSGRSGDFPATFEVGGGKRSGGGGNPRALLP